MEKEALTDADLELAQKKIDALMKDHKRAMRAAGVPAFITAIASVADKLSRGENGQFKGGWFYSYIISNVLSGASAQLLQDYVKLHQTMLGLQISKSMHREFDNAPIAERQSRNTEKTATNVDAMKAAMDNYLGAKGQLLSGIVSSTAFVGLTIVSGGAASLPIMGAVIASSGIMSYLMNGKMNVDKLDMKNKLLNNQADLRSTDRKLYTASYKLETSDKDKKAQQIFDAKQEKYLSTYKKFIKMLNKYAVIGTIMKGVILSGVVVATMANPMNALVTFGAAIGAYSAVQGCVNSWFSIKEHVGNFAHAYKKFMPKMKVKFGKEKIKQNANTIELENIVVKKRSHDDPTKPSHENLFSGEGNFRIGPGITLLGGASGAGKSTLIDLLMHSNDVNGGTIKIGTVDKKGNFTGQNYDDLAFGEPAKHIALSMQNGELLDVTVDEYIRLSNPNAPEELVDKVKNLLGIKDDPSNPSSISPDLVIDAAGKNVSGGQANRLNLAQALIKDSPILILDEPTAGIDPTMSENIVKYLNEIKKDKTIVYITHNMKDIDNPDGEALHIDQALDLGKDVGATSATIARIDWTNESERKEYLEFFANRNIGRSPSSPTLSAEELAAKKETLLQKSKENEQRILGHTATTQTAAPSFTTHSTSENAFERPSFSRSDY
ncbi:MAG: ABC transporter ATP-binding protein [Alphaproteobacteria bacterium]